MNIFFHPTFLSGIKVKWIQKYGCTWNAYRRYMYIDISFSACQHNVCIKATGQQKLHKYDQYIYTDNSQLIKGGQFKLGPAPIKCHLINSVLPSKVKGGPIYQGLPHNTKIRNEEECIWCVQGFSISIHLNHVQAMGKLAYSGWFNYLIRDGSVF